MLRCALLRAIARAPRGWTAQRQRTGAVETWAQSHDPSCAVCSTCARESFELVAASHSSSSHQLDQPTAPVVCCRLASLAAVSTHGVSHDLQVSSKQAYVQVRCRCVPGGSVSVPAPAPAPVVARDAGTAHDDAAATLDHGVVATRNTGGTPAGLWPESMLGTTRTTRRSRPVCLAAHGRDAHRVRSVVSRKEKCRATQRAYNNLIVGELCWG